VSSLEGAEIFADGVVLLTLDHDGLIAFRRLPGSYDLHVDYPRMVQGVIDAIDAHRDEARGVLVDVRAGVGRHEPEFEEPAKRFNIHVAQTFGKVAWLVASNVGQLQAARFAQATGIQLRAFTVEAEARVWLLQ
jgi:hypothetical protein